jgi:hypothetical protein
MLEWLTDEFERAKGRIRSSHSQWMEQQGVSEAALARAGGFGVGRAAFGACGDWEPADEDGEPAIVLPCWTPEGEGPRVLYDLVAFRPGQPYLPARRRLDAAWLGEDEQATAAFWHLPLTVRTDALTWLRSGSKGIVVLDWPRAVPHLLEMAELCGETDELTKILRVQLTRALLDRLPRISDLPRAKERSAPERDIDLGHAA